MAPQYLKQTFLIINIRMIYFVLHRPFKSSNKEIIYLNIFIFHFKEYFNAHFCKILIIQYKIVSATS